MAKKVVKMTIDGNIEYDTVEEAASSIDAADPKVIEKVLKGKLQSAYGCRWRWKQEEKDVAGT